MNEEKNRFPSTTNEKRHWRKVSILFFSLCSCYPSFFVPTLQVENEKKWFIAQYVNEYIYFMIFIIHSFSVCKSKYFCRLYDIYTGGTSSHNTMSISHNLFYFILQKKIHDLLWRRFGKNNFVFVSKLSIFNRFSAC